MRFYNEHIYPWLVSSLGDPKPIQEVRQRIVPLAQGAVLEIGVGPGVNFAHYNPTTVSKVYALEPNRGMVRLAEQRRHETNLNIESLIFLANASRWKMLPLIPSSVPLRCARFQS